MTSVGLGLGCGGVEDIRDMEGIGRQGLIARAIGEEGGGLKE